MISIGEEKGELIRGFIRVNAKNARDSYVSNSDSTLPDYFLTSTAERNGALDGDEVLIKIKPQEQWQEGKKTATVVYILNKVKLKFRFSLHAFERKNYFRYIPEQLLEI